MKKMKLAAVLIAIIVLGTACAGKAEETSAAAETEAVTEATEEAETSEEEDKAAEESQEAADTASEDEDEALAKETARVLAKALKESIDEITPEDLAIAVAYPCYVGVGKDGETVKNEEEFLAIDPSQYLTEELKEAIKAADTDSIEWTEAGLVVGAPEGTPNVVFGLSADGTVGITGINP